MDVIKQYLNEIPKVDLKDFNVELNKELALKIAAGSLTSLTAIYLSNVYLSYGYFKERGLKTPQYKFIYGNLKELQKDKNESEVVKEWTKKFGKTYGYYQGHMPVLVTSDLDLIQEVFIKQFNNFSARKKLPLETHEQSKNKSLIRSALGRWKRMRVIMNPTFSGSKLREMGPLIVTCTNRLIDQLTKNSETEINMSNYLKRFTMDSIWNCAFGLDIDLQNDKNENLYFTNSEKIFRESAMPSPIIIFSSLFYELNSIFIILYNLMDKIQCLIFGKETAARIWLHKEIGQLLMRRKLEKIDKRDYMQLLLDSESNDFKPQYDQTDLKDLNNVHLEKKLTTEEIRANLIMFMLAGYETTSTALSYSCFVLATNQIEQQKVRDEVDAYFADSDEKPNTENIKNLPYLENFIKEVLRVYPIARSIRRCVNETTIKGIKMTPGLNVRCDHLTIHFDPEYWGPSDPYDFNPSRHESKRNPLTFLSFGAGPRNCIGMKFALVEMKLALVNLLLNFEILPSENTPKKLELIEGIVRSPKHGVPLKLKTRN